MSYIEHIHELKNRLTKEHQEIAHYVEHTFQAIDQMEEHHRKLSATYALQGYKISGNEEQVFHNTLEQLRKYLIETLEKTVEDFTHKGDKNWEKNFK
ncbi:MAG: hypothetical protein A2189_00265, partial [Paenibacillus sp. RIFOXYA1_FULL_44_5]